MAIYGNTISFGGGGQNDTLPPLLDNFRASKGKAETVAFQDVPYGSTVLFGSYKGKKIKWEVVDLNQWLSYKTWHIPKALKIYDKDLISKRAWNINSFVTYAPEPAFPNDFDDSTLGLWLNGSDKTNEQYNEPEFLYGWTEEEKSYLLTGYSFGFINDIRLPEYSPSDAISGYDMNVPLEQQDLFWTDGNIGGSVKRVYRYETTNAFAGEIEPEGMSVDPDYLGKIEPWFSIKQGTPFVFSGKDYVLESAAETQPIVISADKMQESRATDLAGAVWVYGDHLPKNVNDGTKIEFKRDEIVADSGTIEKSVSWDKSKNFYVRQFSYNFKKQYQTMLNGAVVKIIKPTMKVSQLEAGDKSILKLGKYNGKYLRWTLRENLNHELFLFFHKDNYLGDHGLFSFRMAWDNKENGTSENRYDYVYSNLHQWLNSDKAANTWFTPTHDGDTAPDYTNQNGFLYEWTEQEKNVVKEYLYSYQHSADDSPVIQAKVVIPSLKETDLEESGIVWDESLSLGSLRYGTNWWLRDADANSVNPDYICFVNHNGYPFGSKSSAPPYDTLAAFPLLHISPDTLVYADPDENGVYSFCFEKEDQIMGTARKVYEYGSVAPEDKNLIWIQPDGLAKFWNGSEWVAIAGVYAEEEG